MANLELNKLLIALIGLFVTVLGAFFWNMVKQTNERIATAHRVAEEAKQLTIKETKEMTTNYKDRFEDVRTFVYDRTELIIANLNDMKIAISEKYVLKEDFNSRLKEIEKKA